MEERRAGGAAKREEEILAFWKREKIFEKTLAKPSPRGEFVFYDGPPFATGLPHYGHLLASTVKDAIPRYKTMRGFRVPRRWGWDCHGLPLEAEIEKELKLGTKRDVEAYGIAAFVARARESVLRYADEWRAQIPRIGRFVDMENDYKTMDAAYTESVWWAFARLFRKGLAYEGFKAMHLCPRCETTLSNFEVAQGYRDLDDLALTVKLELTDEPGTSLLAWTTTGWTLPGNAAAAVNADLAYLKAEVGGEKFVVAKSRRGVLPPAAKILEEFPGKKLVGLAYRPPFDFFREELSRNDRAFRVYGASFVGGEEGTGIVHVAPAFGAEDLALAEREKIPLVRHVGSDGRFRPGLGALSGKPAKPKGDPQAADREIAEDLARRGLLFAKETVTHAYPLCWRCDTPLLNFASSSWFVKVSALRGKLLRENRKVRWVPEEIRDGRFGKWLEGARDWAVSRSRFFGAPLPVWKSAETGECVVVGSLAELAERLPRSGNRYLFMRHGEAENNVRGILSAKASHPHGLTERGREQVLRAASKLPPVDLIYTSPFPRARESAELVAKFLKLPPSSVREDARLGEIDTGDLDGKPVDVYHRLFSSDADRFERRPPGGESMRDVKRRAGAFLHDLETRERGKTILIVTHADVAWMLEAAARACDARGTCALKTPHDREFIENAEVRELSFVPLPHNADFELDLHRPTIDGVKLLGRDGALLSRVPDVFDCWFESGSMPFAAHHYLGRRLPGFAPAPGLFGRPRGYPADFIAEGIDQTRGWFYTLLVLGTALFGRAPYKTVVVNGIVLAEDGQKMSKRLKNYPDPMDIVRRYGADAMRLYLLASPVVRGEDIRFSEAGVDDVAKKLFGRLANVLSFYELYAPAEENSPDPRPRNVLDRWILARLAELSREVTEGLEAYELDRAARPFLGFADDLSTWYLRRSRERFKEGGREAAQASRTMRFVLRTLALLLAPFAPFFAETLFRSARTPEDPESVHLADWPEGLGRFSDGALLLAMADARRVASLGLEARFAAGIKVRQPLARLSVRSLGRARTDEFLSLVREEVNVLALAEDPALADEAILDTALTDELRAEGAIRDFLRHVQDLRKRAGLKPGERAALSVEASEGLRALLAREEARIKKTASLSSLSFGEVSGGSEAAVGEETTRLSLARSA